MPLPLIIAGAAALATIYGAKKGYDGYQKHSDADDVVNNAKRDYDKERNILVVHEATAHTALEQLGMLELEIGQQFDEFKTLADTLIEKLNATGQKSSDIKVNISRQQLQKIENYTYSAIGVLGSVAGAGVAGVAAGFAVYGGVMALGAASTGTAISALSGIAASNAALAAIGGGSLAAGGLGIAGGTTILGAAVAAPILAIAGWAYDSHGEEALKNARKAAREASAVTEKLKAAQKLFYNIEVYALKIERSLIRIDSKFEKYLDELKAINNFIEDIKGRNIDVGAEIKKHGETIMLAINNGYALAAILTDIIVTPLFKLKQVDGNVVMDKNGVPEMEKDADGSMILNSEAIDKSLGKAV